MIALSRWDRFYVKTEDPDMPGASEWSVARSDSRPETDLRYFDLSVLIAKTEMKGGVMQVYQGKETTFAIDGVEPARGIECCNCGNILDT